MLSIVHERFAVGITVTYRQQTIGAIDVDRCLYPDEPVDLTIRGYQIHDTHRRHGLPEKAFHNFNGPGIEVLFLLTWGHVVLSNVLKNLHGTDPVSNLPCKHFWRGRVISRGGVTTSTTLFKDRA